MEQEDKVKICSLVAHAILADGQITDDERGFLDTLMARFALSPAEQKTALSRNMDDDAAALADGIHAFESRNAMMVELVMAVASDGELSASERAMLDTVAEAIGVEKVDMDMLVQNALM